jgi:NAD(P)-dependent dehydrogenase (short-subunit alcohol dehydrogenase family)
MGKSKSNAFGKKTTAKNVVDAHGEGKYLDGKTAIVTGGNSGIGLETCKALASAGARVILCSRSVEGGQKAIEEEIKKPGHGGYVVEDVSKIVVKPLELADLKSIKALADDILATEERIDFLVLNAGIMALAKREETSSGFEKQIGVNHFGHFYLYSLLENKLKAQNFPSRVVVLSSSAHMSGTVDVENLHFTGKRSYGRWSAYGQSKMANILFTKEVADRTKGNSQITAVCLHPGVIGTNLGRNMAMPGFIRSLLTAVMVDKTIPQGAATTLYACLAKDLDKEENRGAYLVDCNIAKPNKEARDNEGIKRKALWEVTDKQIQEALVKLEIK